MTCRGAPGRVLAMPKSKPTPQARALAEALRVARKAARLAATEVADKLAWSQSTISRIETGVHAASAEEVSLSGPRWFLSRSEHRPTRGLRTLPSRCWARRDLPLTSTKRCCAARSAGRE
ncbi:helix-turn-helix transcriptional regulator [Amycolatopsis japonica]